MIDKIGSCIWQAKGILPHPHMVVIGGIHGDELTGIEVVKYLRETFLNNDKNIKNGTLTLILGNEKAIEMGKRATKLDRNLNRMFSEKHLSGPALDYYESRRAHELAPILKSADICIDIHSTSTSSKPFLSCSFTRKHETVYRWFSAEIVLSDPKFVLSGGEPSSTDEYVDSCGGIGICCEIGWKKDTSRVTSITENILNILADQGLISSSKPVRPPTTTHKVYELIRRIDLTNSGFRFAKGFPEAFQEVKGSEVIGYHNSILEIAEEDSVIAFPKAVDQWQVGQDIFFLARQIK